MKLMELEVEVSGMKPQEAEDLIRFVERIADDDDFTRCAETAIRGGGCSGMSANFRSVMYSTYVTGVREGPPMVCPKHDTATHASDYWVRLGKWRVCSYCHSMHPDDLVEALRAGEAKFNWSDKRYKAYVELPGVPNASHGPIKFYTWHLTERTVHELYDYGKLGTDSLSRETGQTRG